MAISSSTGALARSRRTRGSPKRPRVTPRFVAGVLARFWRGQSVVGQAALAHQRRQRAAERLAVCAGLWAVMFPAKGTAGRGRRTLGCMRRASAAAVLQTLRESGGRSSAATPAVGALARHEGNGGRRGQLGAPGGRGGRRVAKDGVPVAGAGRATSPRWSRTVGAARSAFQLLVTWRGNAAAVHRQLVAEGIVVPGVRSCGARIAR